MPPDGMPPLVLTGQDLTLEQVEAVARLGVVARLDDRARERMLASRRIVEELVASGEPVYGVTTGFGDLATHFIPAAEARRLQRNLLVSHAVGVGRPISREAVRAMLLLRANTLARGQSGCRPIVVERLVDFLRLGIHPVVPEQGSVGASGDLAPLAHLALPLLGRGRAELDGDVVDAAEALRRHGLEPLELEAKEGLALLNGTQLMSAIGALAVLDAQRLAGTASVIAAMSVEALLGTDVAFAAAYHAARPHPGQGRVATELRHLLRDSGLMRSHHGEAHKVQDPTRCAARHRSTARAGTRSTTPEGSWRSRSTARPTTRWSSPAARGSTPTRSRQAAGGSSPAATSTASRWPSRWTSRRSRSPSWGRSPSGARRCSSTVASRACRRSSPTSRGSTAA